MVRLNEPPRSDASVPDRPPLAAIPDEPAPAEPRPGEPSAGEPVSSDAMRSASKCESGPRAERAERSVSAPRRSPGSSWEPVGGRRAPSWELLDGRTGAGSVARLRSTARASFVRSGRFGTVRASRPAGETACSWGTGASGRMAARCSDGSVGCGCGARWPGSRGCVGDSLPNARRAPSWSRSRASSSKCSGGSAGAIGGGAELVGMRSPPHAESIASSSGGREGRPPPPGRRLIAMIHPDTAIRERRRLGTFFLRVRGERPARAPGPYRPCPRPCVSDRWRGAPW